MHLVLCVGFFPVLCSSHWRQSWNWFSSLVKKRKLLLIFDTEWESGMGSKFTHGLSPHFPIAKTFYTRTFKRIGVAVRACVRVRGIERGMWIAIENGIFDSNMVLPFLEKRDTRKFVVVVVIVNGACSHVPLLSFTRKFCCFFTRECHSIRVVWEQTYEPQRTWDSNLLRRLIHQSNGKMCTLSIYMREIHVHTLVQYISIYIFSSCFFFKAEKNRKWEKIQ